MSFEDALYVVRECIDCGLMREYNGYLMITDGCPSELIPIEDFVNRILTDEVLYNYLMDEIEYARAHQYEEVLCGI